MLPTLRNFCVPLLLACLQPLAHAGLNASSTVFVIVMENHNWSSIKGNADAPYINNTLLPMASYAEQYYNPPGIHPSEPNYLWLESGTGFGITNDNAPSSNAQSTTSHFVTQLQNAGISWKTYQENISGTSVPLTDSYPYAVKHNPFAYFTDITSNTSYAINRMRPFTELANDLANNTLARYNFITPNLINDMHDSAAPLNNPVKQGDTWLSQNLPGILNSQAYQNGGLLIITWDEGGGGSDGPIGFILLSPFAKGGGYHNSIHYTHSSTLRTLQKIFGVAPFLRDAANVIDVSDLLVGGAVPNSDSPAVTTIAASNVGGGAATLNALVNPDGDTTAVWFEYGLTTGYGSTTRTTGSDNAESYSGWSYGSNGGSGFGPAHYLEGAGGGIFLANTASGGRQIDGNQSFGVFAGSLSGNTQAMDRQILNAQASGTLTLSARFDVDNATAFSGFNLKSTEGTAFGTNELISVGLRPANGNTTIAVNGGAQTINLGSEIRGGIIDFSLAYDCVAGTYTLGAKFRASANFTTVSGPLKITGQTANYLGFGNFNSGNNQNAIFDGIAFTNTASAGSGPNAVAVSAPAAGLTPDTTYHFRAVAQNSRGMTYGADQTFGFPLLPAGNAAYHSVTSGDFQARLYDATGHLAIAGPDLSGNPFANVTTFAPPAIKTGGTSYNLGALLSATSIANGLQVTQSLANTVITAQLTFPGDGVMRYEVVDWGGLVPGGADITAASGTNEHFFGFGEKFNTIDQAGNKVHMLTYDYPGSKGDHSYKPVPWFISTNGYGFHLDSTAESWFDMRNSSADRYTVQNLYGALKFNVVSGPKLTDVLTRYTGYTGRPYLPPPWVFGTWISSDIWRTGGEVKYAVTKYLQNGIPASVFVFDSPWEVSYNDFTWNLSGSNTQLGAGGIYESGSYTGFTSVPDMMNFFQTNGLKVVCWMTPFINTSSFQDNVNGVNVPGQNTGQASNYATGAANNYFVRSSAGGPPLVVPWWKGSGSPVDFTNAAAKSWFTGQLQSLVTQSNVTTLSGSSEPVIGGFKTDDGETSNGSNTYIPATAVYSDGRTGTLMQNGFCVEYHKTVSSVFGSNGILFARSGFAGTQQYPGGWAGDNEPNFGSGNGLQSVIVAGQSAAMSGFAIWSHDIGGYQNSNFESNPADLFMRWTQFGAFTPVMQLHRQVDPNNLQQYPWGYGATALANFVTYAKLHSQLFPYIYSYAKEASIDGLPIIRPPVLLNQTDTATYGIQHSYYFGNEFYVAPMNALNATSRGVYLPVGTWYDFWTNAVYTGGQAITWSNADSTKMPVFVRKGSVIPMLASAPQSLNTANYVNNSNLATVDSTLQFLVYPGSSPATFNVYDGTVATCSVNGTVTTLTLSGTARTVLFKVLASAPAGVERNGIRLPALASLSAFDAASLGWYYDGAFVRMKFSHGGGNATVTFGPDSVGDGATDSWRNFYGITNDNADTDGDGLTNLQEYRAGTDPTNSQNRFAIQNVTPQPGGGFQIAWQSQPGIVYRVQWKAALTDATWQTISPDFTGTGGAMTWTDDGSQTGGLAAQKRFYRLAVP